MPFKSDGKGQNSKTSEKQSNVDEYNSSDRLVEQTASSNASSPSPYESSSEKSHDENEMDLENRVPRHLSTKTKRRNQRIYSDKPGKRARTLLTLEQSRVLHELLQETSFPSTKVREEVAAKLGLSPRKVQVFFQNKRQKQRKKSNLSTSASQPQKIAPKPNDPSVSPRPNVGNEPTLLNQSDPHSIPNVYTNTSYSSFRGLPWSETLYSQRPYENYGYEPTRSSSLFEQRRPRYTYQPYTTTYWHPPSGIHRNIYQNFAPRVSHRLEYRPKTIDPAKEMLPPIMSNVRSSAPRLPSINEMISGAHA